MEQHGLDWFLFLKVKKNYFNNKALQSLSGSEIAGNYLKNIYRKVKLNPLQTNKTY